MGGGGWTIIITIRIAIENCKRRIAMEHEKKLPEINAIFVSLMTIKLV